MDMQQFLHVDDSLLDKHYSLVVHTIYGYIVIMPMASTGVYDIHHLLCLKIPYMVSY